MEKLRELDVKQEMLTIESWNNHVLVTDIQTNVQEIHQNILGTLKGQVKAVCNHLHMIHQNIHSLIRTDQKLDMISNKVGIGGDTLADKKIYSVHPSAVSRRESIKLSRSVLAGETNGAEIHSGPIFTYYADKHVLTSMVRYVILRRFLREIPSRISSATPGFRLGSP